MTKARVIVGRGPTAARRDYRMRLAVQWITVHRPDVLEAIEVEVAAKYPFALKRRPKTVLPETLARMK